MGMPLSQSPRNWLPLRGSVSDDQDGLFDLEALSEHSWVTLCAEQLSPRCWSIPSGAGSKADKLLSQSC